MDFKHEQLRNQMLRDKEFLKELYECSDLEKKKTLLNFASDLKVH